MTWPCRAPATLSAGWQGAQADGDLGALASLGRPVSRVYVEGTGAEDVMALADCLRRQAGGTA